MFGLEISDPHEGYFGARLLYNRHGLELLGDRTARGGAEESIRAVLKWLDTPNKKDGPRGGKRSPWRRLQVDFPNRYSAGSSDVYEEREGPFVLRATAMQSYGYVYMAAFKIPAVEITTPDGAPVGKHSDSEPADFGAKEASQE